MEVTVVNPTCMHAQTCLTVCDPMDSSLLGSFIHGILQARILEWIAIPSSQGTFQTHVWNLGLLHCRQILYLLSHQACLHPRLYPFLNLQIVLGLAFSERHDPIPIASG